MGLFKRNKHGNSLSAVDVAPVLFEQPQNNAGELEQMVYSVYEEKLDLERQLEAANKRITELEETKTKLRAAETFSRQSEADRKKAESGNDELRRQIERLEDNLKRSRSHATTLQLKLDDLQKVSEGQMREYRRKLVDEMKQRVPEWTGRWTQARVIEFLESCAHEQAEQPFYKRGGVFVVDGDNDGKTGGGSNADG